MWDISPTLVRYGAIEPSSVDVARLGLARLAAQHQGSQSSSKLELPVKNFYMTDPISRRFAFPFTVPYWHYSEALTASSLFASSVTMSACSRAFVDRNYKISLDPDAQAQEVSGGRADTAAGQAVLTSSFVQSASHNAHAEPVYA
jgi:hypothetical protein